MLGFRARIFTEGFATIQIDLNYKEEKKHILESLMHDDALKDLFPAIMSRWLAAFVPATLKIFKGLQMCCCCCCFFANRTYVQRFSSQDIILDTHHIIDSVLCRLTIHSRQWRRKQANRSGMRLHRIDMPTLKFRNATQEQKHNSNKNKKKIVCFAFQTCQLSHELPIKSQSAHSTTDRSD